MKTLLLLIMLLYVAIGFSQKAMPFKEAREQGISPQVDSIYKSAVFPSQPEKAVFKTDDEVQKHIAAYQEFLLDFGYFLLDNKFKWEETTRGFNRIYIAEDGTVEYFLYDFKTIIDPAKEAEFRRLLNLYINDHKFGIIAPEKFAQCSPVTYPKSE